MGKYHRLTQSSKTLKKRRSLRTKIFPVTNEQHQLTRTFSSCSMNDESSTPITQNSSGPHSDSTFIFNSNNTPLWTTEKKIFNLASEPFEHSLLEKK
jgi:hypothetical protein